MKIFSAFASLVLSIAFSSSALAYVFKGPTVRWTGSCEGELVIFEGTYHVRYNIIDNGNGSFTYKDSSNLSNMKGIGQVSGKKICSSK